MSHRTPSRLLFAFLLVAVVFLLQAPEALAAGLDISTDGFSCASPSSQQLFMTGSTCPTSLTMDNVFSFLVCNMEQLSANIMGHMYCSMIVSLTPSVMAAVTLATVIYALMFTFGMIPATGQEAVKFLLKCAFVIAFATNADYIIGIAYRGALGAISLGASIAISIMPLPTGTSTTSADVYSQLDGFLGTLFHDATDMMGGTTDTTICGNAIFAVLATMAVVFPLLAYMGLMLVGRILITMFRAVFGYIYAIVGITFVLLLAPFFVTFALFKLTSSLFERWLGYLVSFALQVVLLFTFLAFIFSMKPQDLPALQNLTSIIMYHEEHSETSTFRLPLSYCTICDFQVVNSDDGTTPLTDSDPNYIAKGQLKCIDHSGDYPTPSGMDSAHHVPIRPAFAASPNSTGQLGALITFAGNGILSLIILALIVEHLLTLIPSLAQKLASSMSASYATQLGGGEGLENQVVIGMPGGSMVQDFNQGFNSGFQSKLKGPIMGNGLSASMQGVKDGMSGLVTGRLTDTNRTGIYAQDPSNKNDPNYNRQQESGITGAFQRYISDPTKFGS